MHQYGRSGLVQQFRGGKEIEPLAQLDYYDFNYQVFFFSILFSFLPIYFYIP